MPDPNPDPDRDPAAPAVEVDLVVPSGGWPDDRPFRDGLVRAARVAIAAAQGPVAEAVRRRGGEAAVVLADDETLRRLNRDYRGRDAATNVLSFPAADDFGSAGPVVLGDVVLGLQTVEREGREQGKPFCHHAAHLVCHGTLHLLGYDHMSESEAAAMEALERSVLSDLGIPDPYCIEERS